MMTASSANAAPQGTVIKEGVLTYPAGPYLKEDPLLLSLGNYTGDNYTQISAEPFKTNYSEKEFLFLYNENQNIATGNLSVWNLWIYHPLFLVHHIIAHYIILC